MIETSDEKPGASLREPKRSAWEDSARGRLQRALVSLPFVGRALNVLHVILYRPDVRDYWETRYRKGGDSGSGSYGRLAEFKAEVINDFVRQHAIESVVEFGCGDGNQLALARYPSYIGVDVSEAALERCRQRFASDSAKRFLIAGSPDIPDADCTLSLDVIMHLIEDAMFDAYMRELFARAKRYVVIYSSDLEDRFAAPHVRHRRFSAWVATEQPAFVLDATIANRYSAAQPGSDTSNASFFIYRRHAC
jgi:SAM-dependent methyltransferase